MNILFLTNGSTHGQSILRALRSRDLLPSTILIERARKHRLDEIRRSIRKYGLWETTMDVIAFLRRELAARGNRAVPFRYEDYAQSVITVPDLNHPDTVGILERRAPDLLVLGGCRILRRPVLSTARLAVLNAHPGRLPDYRGVDVIPWAIHNGDQPFVTVHCVNAGVDTGDIVSQQELSVDPGDSISTLREKAELLAAELMVKAVKAIVETGRVDGTPQTLAECRQYSRMPRQLMRKAEEKLRCTWKSHQ
jgi:methionyl-tRNA formyltransferase